MFTKSKIHFCGVSYMITVLSLFMTTLCVFISPARGLAANYPLEITNIKPAGAGTPAIPATNRIFRAYPGIEYNIGVAVIGGAYPFTYSLSNAPLGMTINADTGEIKWPNPQANSGNITLTVTDSETTTVTTTWSINVSKTGFYFVDSTFTGAQTGTISNPFSSINNFISSSISDQSGIVYFRNGTYSFVPYQGLNSVANEMNLRNKPHAWLGYPGEKVTMTGGNTTPTNYLRSMTGVYLENIHFSTFDNKAMMLTGGHHYQTIRSCKFSDVTATESTNNNQGFIVMEASVGSPGYYSVIQSNELYNFTGASAIGSLYDTTKLLIADNYIHDAGGTGLTSINNGIAPKSRTNYLTIRNNSLIMKKGTYIGTNMNSFMYQSSHIEIAFNRFIGSPTSAQNFNSRSDGLLHNFNYYRNTIEGDIVFENINGNDCSTSGPFNLYNNVIINSNTAPVGSGRTTLNFISFYKATAINNPEKCINDTNNLKGLPTDNIIDSEGNLTYAYNSYAGGALQFKTSTAPTAPTAPKAPKGLIKASKVL